MPCWLTDPFAGALWPKSQRAAPLSQRDRATR